MQPLPPEPPKKVTPPLSATCGGKRNSKRLWKSEENLVDLHATGMVQSSIARETAEDGRPHIVLNTPCHSDQPPKAG
jgi:hypothetical protein